MRHVIVVEDDLQNALVFRMLLERRGGYRVTVTESAGAVLDEVRAGTVDLIVLDVSLANTRHEGRALTGIDLCRLIRQEPGGARLPVVLATAHAMRGDAEAFLARSGANAYVAKPILDHAAFLGEIRMLLEEAA
jgi:CheY-like chemotaxis protein